MPAIVVSGPFGAVKEQSSGVYAHNMAQRGFITLAFDPSFTGESGGEACNIASQEIFTEDFSAAVDYIGLLPNVDRERIGLIGVCGFSGLGLNATIIDPRIKAAATAVMYDMSRFLAKGANDSFTEAQRRTIIDTLARQRWEDVQNGTLKFAAHGIYFDENGEMVQPDRFLPEELPENHDPVLEEFYEYYRGKRGFHKNSVNSTGAFSTTSPLVFMNAPQLTYLKEISPRPIMLIAGEVAHSRYYSEDIYNAAAEPKELVIVPGTNHCDLYDKVELIPFDKLEGFFKQYL
nr:alpha/beta hydrolase [uncultured Haemophilus sp.]